MKFNQPHWHALREAKSTPRGLTLDLWADRFFKLKSESQRRRLRLLLQMIEASLAIRSFSIRKGACLFSRTTGEDAGAKYDRLLKRLFGLEWDLAPDSFARMLMSKREERERAQKPKGRPRLPRSSRRP